MAKHAMARVGELPEGGGKLMQLGSLEVGLFLVKGEYHAYRNMCPHAGAPVCAGALNKVLTAGEIVVAGREQPIIRCPWHGWEFDLTTGCHTFTQARLKSYEVEIEGEEIYVSLPDPPPPVVQPEG